MSISEKMVHIDFFEIKIYREGAFWVAYEQSAFYFAQQKGYKPTKKFVKCVDSEVVSIGFPNSALEELKNTVFLKNGISITSEDENFKILRLEKEIVKEEFETWKTDISVKSANAEVQNFEPLPTAEIQVIEKIKKFDLANATPMQCLNFVAELKGAI
jgi:hypothetical protein